MDHAFGDALRELRQRAGLSLADLARLIPFSKELIAKVETGTRRPTPDLAWACDRALGTQPLLALLCEHGGDDVDRRQALVGTVGYLATGAVQGLDGLAEMIRHGLHSAAGADDWDTLVAGYARGLITAPGAEYGPRLLADLNLLLQLVRDGRAGRDQLRAAAGLGNFFGHWRGNHGNLDDAHRWYRTAAHLADQSGDTGFAAYVRGRTAVRATYEGATVRQIEETVAQVLTATRGRPSVATLEAYAAAACLAAVICDADRGHAAIRAMRDTAAALPPDADPWGAASPAARALFIAAYTECRVGTEDTAAPVIEQALAELDQPMWLAEVEQYRARTMVAAGDVAGGVSYALDAAQRVPHAARVISVAVRDVVDQVPADHRSDDLEELRRYASTEPPPWETIR